MASPFHREHSTTHLAKRNGPAGAGADRLRARRLERRLLNYRNEA